MRWLNVSFALAAAACLGASGAAQAHWRVGVYMGGPVYPYYYPPPVVPAPYYYAPYPPPVVLAPEAPDTTYVERSDAQARADSQPPQGTWWYCDKTKTYYPYVKQCASGWREVPATPPAPSR